MTAWTRWALPGLWQWRCGMQKEALAMSLGTVGAACGAVLMPWTTWDSFVVGLLCFRAVLGLYAAAALGMRVSLVGVGALMVLPERILPSVVGLRRAAVPLLLLALMTAGLIHARYSTRVFPEAAVLEPTPQGPTYRNEPNAMSVHFPTSWTVNSAVGWPMIFTAQNPAGTCQARVMLTYAPPLPDALEGFYVERMMAHHLGVRVTQASDRMYVSMFPTRQFVVEGAGQQSVFTAAERGSQWVIMQLTSTGELGACAMDFSRVRSSWMLW